MKVSREFLSPEGVLGSKVWEEQIFEQFNGMELARRAPTGPFRGGYRIDATMTTRSCRVAGTPHCIRRRGDACGPEVGIMKVVSGRTRMEQAGRTFDLKADDIILFDNGRPYQVDMHDTFEHVLILFDRDSWAPEVAEFERFGYRTLPEAPSKRLLAALLESFVRNAPEMDAPQLQEVALPLAQLALAGTSGEMDFAPRDRQSRLLFQRICADIRNRLPDPDLTPAALATRHRISLRYLHKLFALRGMSVMRFVRRERLARCASDLRNSAGREQIAAIASRWGFDDYTTFRRAFLTRYGISPSAFDGRAER